MKKCGKCVICFLAILSFLIVGCENSFAIQTVEAKSDSFIQPCPEGINYKKMVEKSLVSTGNNARIKAVIKKAKKGKKVTFAYIGGSITEGAGAKRNRNCYARAFATAFEKRYGKKQKVDVINAGMSGTPSSLGIIRYERDVLNRLKQGKTPDILFVEFAVNDRDECTQGGAYEALIRKALKAGSAVVLVFSVFRDNWNMQDTYIPYGKYYGLPMVSVKNGVNDAFLLPGFIDWYFHDYWHPTDSGHKLMADCIMNLFGAIEKEPKEKDQNRGKAKPYNTDIYENTQMITPKTRKENKNVKIKVGGFSKRDLATGRYYYNRNQRKFPQNWKHTTDSGNKPFRLEVTCKNLLITYKFSDKVTTGIAEVYVNGKKKAELNGYKSDGWNNATTICAIRGKKKKKYQVEIRMARGDEKKEFTVLALGMN